MRGRKRRYLVALVAAVIVLSIASVAILYLQREALEIEATNTAMVPDIPQAGMTQLRASLVLRNVGPATVRLQLMTLFATDPGNGTLFDTFTHENILLEPGGTQTFSEVTNVTGHWTEVALTVKVFPINSPSWDSSLVPDQPVTWTA